MSKSTDNPITNYPIVFFYILAFAIAWLGMIPQAAYSRGRFPFDSVIFTFLAGGAPTLAAVTVLFVLKGKNGPDELWAALKRWRVSFIWYVTAVFGGLVIVLLTFGLSVPFGIPFPNLTTSFPWAAFPGIFIAAVIELVWEQVGWRGFALPRLQARFNALVASLIVGVLWGIWHLPLFWNLDLNFSQTPIALFIAEFALVSILYTWLFNSTKGSLIFVTLFHASADVFIQIPVAMNVDLGQHLLFRIIVLFIIAVILVVVYGPEKLSASEKAVLE